MRGLLVNPITNHPNSHHKNCVTDNKVNYYVTLGVKGLT